MNEINLRCIFCRMSTSLRLGVVPLCSICRDQLYDFFWVSLVQISMWGLGAISGFMFVVEEILLFIVLVIVKHRIPPPWENT